jgi:hypothetical protein
MNPASHAENMHKYCILCKKEYGPSLKSCCTPNSVVAVQRTGVLRKRTEYFSLDGVRLDEKAIKEREDSERIARSDLLKEREAQMRTSARFNTELGTHHDLGRGEHDFAHRSGETMPPPKRDIALTNENLADQLFNLSGYSPNKRPASVALVSWLVIVFHGISLFIDTTSIDFRVMSSSGIMLLLLCLAFLEPLVMVVLGIGLLRGANLSRIFFLMWVRLFLCINIIGAVVITASGTIPFDLLGGVPIKLFLLWFFARPSIVKYFEPSPEPKPNTADGRATP